MKKEEFELIPTISLEHGEGEVVGAYLPMNRMKREIPKHSNSLDRIRALENENKRLEEENKNLNIKVASLEGEIKGLNSTIEKLKEENQTLELWLDRKEKLNEKYRKELKNYVYDAKQVRDIC